MFIVVAIAGNKDATRLTGINSRAIKLSVFAISGFFVSVAALVLFGHAGAAASSTSPGIEFAAITAAFLDGISFKGGEGKSWVLVTGVFILGVLGNSMQLIGMGTYAQYIVRGLVLLAAVGFDTNQRIGHKTARPRTGIEEKADRRRLFSRNIDLQQKQ